MLCSCCRLDQHIHSSQATRHLLLGRSWRRGWACAIHGTGRVQTVAHGHHLPRSSHRKWVAVRRRGRRTRINGAIRWWCVAYGVLSTQPTGDTMSHWVGGWAKLCRGWLGSSSGYNTGSRIIREEKIMGRRLQGRKLYRLDEENASFNGYCTGGGWELKMFCACGFCV